MTMHSKLDCLCSECGAVFAPMEDGEGCYRCGHVQESSDADHLLQEVALAVRYNRYETGLPISAAFFIISGGDHYITHATGYLHVAECHACRCLDETSIYAYLDQLNDVYDKPLDKALAMHLRRFLRRVAAMPATARGDP